MRIILGIISELFGKFLKKIIGISSIIGPGLLSMPCATGG